MKCLILIFVVIVRMISFFRITFGRGSTYAAAGRSRVVVIIVVVGHSKVLLLDQLLGALDLVQSNALGGSAGFPDSLSVCLALRFTLLVANRWHKGSTRYG